MAELFACFDLRRTILDGEVAGTFFSLFDGVLSFSFLAGVVGGLPAFDADVAMVDVVVDGTEAGEV